MSLVPFPPTLLCQRCDPIILWFILCGDLEVFAALHSVIKCLGLGLSSFSRRGHCIMLHCHSEDNSKMRPPHPTSASFAQIFVATWMRPSSTHCHHADPVPLGPPLGRSGPSHTFRLHCDMHAPPRRRPSPTRISHCSSEDQIGLASSSHIITALEQQAYCAVSLCGPDHGTAPLLCMPSVDRQNDLRG